MKITVAGRHMELTDALRSYIETSLRKFECHFDKVIDADVVLDVQKHRHIAEINLSANGVRVHGREVSSDMYASVDSVIEKIDKQVRKYKGRINRHQPRSSNNALDYGHAIISMQGDNGQDKEEDAVAHNHQVVEREKLSMKPLSVNEAVMQLDLVEDPFLVFLNVDTSRVNVLYSRNNGNYGLIEPEF